MAWQYSGTELRIPPDNKGWGYYYVTSGGYATYVSYTGSFVPLGLVTKQFSEAEKAFYLKEGTMAIRELPTDTYRYFQDLLDRDERLYQDDLELWQQGEQDGGDNPFRKPQNKSGGTGTGSSGGGGGGGGGSISLPSGYTSGAMTPAQKEEYINEVPLLDFKTDPAVETHIDDTDLFIVEDGLVSYTNENAFYITGIPAGSYLGGSEAKSVTAFEAETYQYWSRLIDTLETTESHYFFLMDLDDDHTLLQGVTGRELVGYLSFAPTANKTITGYSVAALPPGLDFEPPGIIRGVPTEADSDVVTVTIYEIEAGVETSRTVDITITVLQGPTPDDPYALDANFEIVNRVLSLPGYSEDPENPPRFYQNENFDLRVTPLRNGVQEILEAEEIEVSFKMFEPEGKIALNAPTFFEVDEKDRIITPIFFNDEKFSAILTRGTALEDTYIDGTLQIELANTGNAVDARDYSATATPVNETLDADEGNGSQFTFELDSAVPWLDAWGATPMQLDLAIVVAADTALNASLSLTFDITEGSDGDYDIGTISGTQSVDRDPTDTVNHYGLTFALDAIAGTATGITVDTLTTTEAMPIPSKTVTILPGNAGIQEDGGSPGTYYLDDGGTEDWDFNSSGATLEYNFTNSVVAYASDIETALQTGLSEPGITVEITSSQIIISGLPDNIVEVVVDGTSGDTYATTQEGLERSAVVSATLTGLEGPGNAVKRLIGQRKIRVYRDH